MSKTVVGLLSLVVGLLVGAVGGGMVGIGAGAGIGIATGLSAGACGIGRAAQMEEMLTEEQVDQVFARAVANLQDLVPEEDTSGEEMVVTMAECEELLAGLRAAAAS